MTEKKWARKMCYALTCMKRMVLKSDDVDALAKMYEEARVSSVQYRNGSHLSEETRRKMSEAKKKMSKETKRKIGLAAKRRIVSEETRRKMSEAHKGKKAYQYGMRMSEEFRRKVSEGHKGQHSPMKGKKHTEEAKRKNSEAHKNKRWFTNGEISVFKEVCPEGFRLGRIYKRNK